MNFTKLKESDGLKFIKIEENPLNTIQVKENGKKTFLTDFCEDIGVNIVFYTSKSIKEQLRYLAPETFHEKSNYSLIFFDIRHEISNKMNQFQSHLPDYKELNSKLLDYQYFESLLSNDEVVEYQIFVPFNGIFFTFDAYRDERLSSLNDINEFLG